MKLSITKLGTIHEYRRIILAGTLATASVVTGACSAKPAQKVDAAQPAPVVAKTGALQVASSVPKTVDVKSITKGDFKPPASKVLRYGSRDYAVSFEYPWQYSFASARKVYENEALQPKADGHDGQITLARVDLPKGFYPDTNFESGYFTLSLNPDIEQKDCMSTLEAEKHGGAQLAKINDTDFFWVETKEGGKGVSSTVRNYVAFANDVCYEVELGVKTRNENGLAREVNADRVMQKLDGMLKTVQIGESEAKPAATDLQSSIEQPKVEGQK